MPCPNCRCPSCLALIGPPTPSTELSLPPSELVTTDRAPTNSEKAHSRNVINFAEQMVPLIQVMIGDLEKRKTELLDLASIHKVAISPLRSFPPELLVEIFAQFIAALKSSHGNPRHSPPLMLMGICSRWRRIVSDTPRLWTRILTVHPMIDLWIAQSKELPLHLEINVPGWPVSYSALSALVSHAHRWEYVDLGLGPNSSSILEPVRSRLHSLKRLDLRFGLFSGTADFFEVAPQLTEVKLTTIYQPVTIKLPWEQLAVCALDNSGLALDVLRQAKNLRICDLDTSNALSFPWTSTGDPHSYHLGLDTLIVHWNHLIDSNIGVFFNSITLPSLRTLKVRFDHTGNTENRLGLATHMSRFFELSSPHLSTLNLADIPFPPSGLIQCLTFLPSVVSLDIQFDRRWHTINDQLLRSLDVNRPGCILPHIHSLSFRGPAEFSEEVLDALVTSRRDINPKNNRITLLENLTLECAVPRGQPTNQLPRFHRFVPEGLNITYGGGWHKYNSIKTHAEPLGEQT